MRSMHAHRYSGRHRAQGGFDAGFALTEVIVSMMIFAIIAAAATYAVTSGIGSSSASRDRVGAANVAQQQLEQARAMPRASLVATPTATSTATVGNGTYTVTRTVGYLPADSTGCPTDVATDAAHEITVHVEVAPTDDGSRTVGLDTVIAC
jgi:prepilin-type N-terminal cleavage/methylation domain-containing protein